MPVQLLYSWIINASVRLFALYYTFIGHSPSLKESIFLQG